MSARFLDPRGFGRNLLNAGGAGHVRQVHPDVLVGGNPRIFEPDGRQTNLSTVALQRSQAITNSGSINAGARLQEPDMVTFGFSAFLKVLSLNEKPQKTEIRKRLAPSSGGGYDFHKSLRQHARRYLVDGEAIPALIASAGTITRLPERQSAIAALHRLEAWRAKTPGEILDFDPIIFESPQHLFRVKFESVFGLRRSGRTTAIHIWNTQRPKLAPVPTYAALALVDQVLQSQERGPDDVGVLSLREPVAEYYFSDRPALSALAASLVEQIEDIIGGPPPPPSGAEDRPSP